MTDRYKLVDDTLRHKAYTTEWARAFRLQRVHLVILGLIGLVFLFGTFATDRFATFINITNVQDQLVALALVALAQTVVILSGGIDLSYAGMMGLLAVLFASIAGDSPQSFMLAYVGIVALGAAFGAINGCITAYSGIHPLIVTLATSTMMSGMALMHSKQPGGSVPVFFEDIVYGRLFGIPHGTIFVVTAYVLIGFMLWRTRFGMRVYATGDDARAAEISGVPVKQTTILVYALSGAIVALAAIYAVGRFGVGDPRAGVGFDLKSITPVIVGGTLLAGGRGGVFGTFLAVILLALLANVLNFLNISSYYQWIIEGCIVVAAVSFFATRKDK
jgi:ribose transport system permease protein